MRTDPFQERQQRQREIAGSCRHFPTTTVGSFPQTPEVRKARRRAEKGEISPEEYDRFLEDQIRHVIRFQEEIGLDVLVHGEFERSDMVEYFGERMEGFAFTRHGWVQSYGSRYVRPPVIFGDVHRPEPMTVRWFQYAQSSQSELSRACSPAPSPFSTGRSCGTISRRSETCAQIALALRDEVTDLEAAGARVIQIDEPALREGLPLRQDDWAHYLDWAIRCFRIAASGVATRNTDPHPHVLQRLQLHHRLDSGHGCRCHVNRELPLGSGAAGRIQTGAATKTRSVRESTTFTLHGSRRLSEMAANLEAASSVLSFDQLWVNPDCGLKDPKMGRGRAFIAAHDQGGSNSQGEGKGSRLNKGRVRPPLKDLSRNVIKPWQGSLQCTLSSIEPAA